MGVRLTVVYCRNAGPGKHFDFNRTGLYLKVEKSGSRRWVQRLAIDGRRRELGLGSFQFVTLREAREKAFLNAKLSREGGDPLALKRQTGIPTFAEAMEKVIEIHAPTWKNGRSVKTWRDTLNKYAVPKMGKKRVHRITSHDIMGCLLPHWEEKQETMRRVRQRLSAIFKWAVAEGYRNDDPAGPAISAALPKPNGRKKHMRAIPHSEVGEAVRKVRESQGAETTKLAFEFLVLTACRSGEVMAARWGEIDEKKAVWTVPPERMKTGKEHRVPLSRQAVSVLEKAKEFNDGTGLIFPSVRGRVLSDSTLSKLLRELKIKAVPHGFRSSFRDWCGETGTDRQIAEASLAHVVSGVEGAYFRSDLFDLRRELIQDWGNYLFP